MARSWAVGLFACSSKLSDVCIPPRQHAAVQYTSVDESRFGVAGSAYHISMLIYAWYQQYRLPLPIRVRGVFVTFALLTGHSLEELYVSPTVLKVHAAFMLLHSNGIPTVLG